jgi:hypothetical protein
MDYTYLPAFTANPYLTSDMLYEYFNKSGILNYICYHITCDAKDPFIQIMLEKTPFCNNIIKEEFVLPSILFKRETTNYKELILNDITKSLNRIGCKVEQIEADAFKGILVDNENICYGLVDLSKIDIKYLELKRSSSTWFVLPTEIVNIQRICNIPVSQKVVDLFTYKKPELSVLYKSDTNECYTVPDIVYTCNDFKTAELQLIFGPPKELVENKMCYTFCNSLDAAINKNLYLNKNKNENEKKGINRIATFIDNDDCIIKNPSIYFWNIESFYPLTIHPFINEDKSEPYSLS